MAITRAKFVLNQIRRHGFTTYEKVDGKNVPVTKEMNTLEFSPVYGNGDPNHENTKFWSASPTGKIELGTVNLAVAAQFELGKEYYIDFTPAE